MKGTRAKARTPTFDTRSRGFDAQFRPQEMYHLVSLMVAAATFSLLPACDDRTLQVVALNA